MLADLPDNHQHATMERAIAFCTRFDQAIDCGAHRGIVTRQLAERFREVVAIEPSELADQITVATVIRAALSNKPGFCDMHDGTQNTGQRYCVEGDSVDVITLDSLHLSPDFLKLDVEGMEFLALKGAELTIRKYQPVIIFEENGLNRRYGIPDNESKRLLESWGAKMVAEICPNGRGKDQVFTWEPR